MREPHLSQTSRCRVGVAVPLSSVPMVVVSLLLPVDAGTHHQDGLTQPNLHPFAGNFRLPFWNPPARPATWSSTDSVLSGSPGPSHGNQGRLQLARVHRHPGRLGGRSPITTTRA